MKIKRIIYVFFMILLINNSLVFSQDFASSLESFNTEIISGSYKTNYLFHFNQEKPAILVIEELITDKKGKTEKIHSKIHLSDLDPTALKFKTEGSFVVISMETRQAQKLIQVLRNDVTFGFVQKVTVKMNDINVARSFIDALKEEAQKCYSEYMEGASVNGAIGWLRNHIKTAVSKGYSYQQTFNPGEKTHLVNITVVSTDPKGMVQKLNYDFSLSDIDPEKLNLESDGNSFSVELSAYGSNNYLRLTREDTEVSYIKTMRLFSDDFNHARNIYLNLLHLVRKVVIPERMQWGNYSQALGFVGENIGELMVAGAKVEQQFGFENQNTGKAWLNVKKTDAKGVVSDSRMTFYLSDCVPEVPIETTSKSIILHLSVLGKKKYIKANSGENPLPYENSLEIYVLDLDKARELSLALKYAIENSKEGLESFTGLDETVNWMKSNVRLVQGDGNEVHQQFDFFASDENRLVFQFKKKDETGKTIKEISSLYIEDLVPDDCEISVNRKKLAVVLSTGKQKFIRNDLDSLQSNYSSGSEVFFDDVKAAKNFLSALVFLRKNWQVPNRSIDEKPLAGSYLRSHISGIMVDGILMEQVLEHPDNALCQAKLSQKTLGKKGEPIDNAYDFAYYDIDPEASSVVTSGKNVQVYLVIKDRKKMIKPYKNGVAGNFISSIEVYSDNLVSAKRLLAAFNSLSKLCNK